MSFLVWAPTQDHYAQLMNYRRAEDASGPITTCEIQTTEEDGVAELPFDDSLKYVELSLDVEPSLSLPHRVIKIILRVLFITQFDLLIFLITRTKSLLGLVMLFWS